MLTALSVGHLEVKETSGSCCVFVTSAWAVLALGFGHRSALKWPKHCAYGNAELVSDLPWSISSIAMLSHQKLLLFLELHFLIWKLGIQHCWFLLELVWDFVVVAGSSPGVFIAPSFAWWQFFISPISICEMSEWDMCHEWDTVLCIEAGQ